MNAIKTLVCKLMGRVKGIESLLLAIIENEGFTLSGEQRSNTVVITDEAAITIPNDASDNLPIGYQVRFISATDDPVGFNAQSPATVNGTSSVGIPDKFDEVLIVKYGPNTWLATGV